MIKLLCVYFRYAARFDCGIEYMLHVQLLKDKKDKIPLHEYKFEDVKPAGRDWFNVGA